VSTSAQHRLPAWRPLRGDVGETPWQPRIRPATHRAPTRFSVTWNLERTRAGCPRLATASGWHQGALASIAGDGNVFASQTLEEDINKLGSAESTLLRTR
jgi:hypothetical protein